MSCLRDQCRFAFFMLLVILCSIYPDRYVAQQRLFESADPLQLRLEAPFRRMISEREGRFAAQMLLASTPADTIDLEIAPRGESRLRSGICDFPGLMLFFADGVEASPFEGQGALPAVTHCKDRDSYEQLALLEYLAYRTYNVLTELSLRVRLARIEYYESSHETKKSSFQEPILSHAFLLKQYIAPVTLK